MESLGPTSAANRHILRHEVLEHGEPVPHLGVVECSESVRAFIRAQLDLELSCALRPRHISVRLSNKRNTGARRVVTDRRRGLACLHHRRKVDLAALLLADSDLVRLEIAQRVALEVKPVQQQFSVRRLRPVANSRGRVAALTSACSSSSACRPSWPSSRSSRRPPDSCGRRPRTWLF